MCFNSWPRGMIFPWTWFLVCTRRQRKGKTVCNFLVRVDTSACMLQCNTPSYWWLHNYFSHSHREGSSWLHVLSLFSLTVNLVDEMVEQFKDEDDFIISVDFDNQKGNVDLYVHYWQHPTHHTNYTCTWYYLLCWSGGQWINFNGSFIHLTYVCILINNILWKMCVCYCYWVCVVDVGSVRDWSMVIVDASLCWWCNCSNCCMSSLPSWCDSCVLTVAIDDEDGCGMSWSEFGGKP